jgi:hypothetical protein
MAAYGLVAWVYRLTSLDAFTLDRDATRELASGIAAAYRELLDGADSQLLSLRRNASVALATMAAGECDLHSDPGASRN